MTSPRRWRLLISPPATGAENMAADEAILESVAQRISGTTLRLYAWSPPCLSLGYAQPAREVDLGRLRDRGWDVVRRPTGGRAILHTDEITYSVSGPTSDRDLTGGVLESYLRISLALAAALEELGVAQLTRSDGAPAQDSGADPICFENPGPYEILAQGKKLIGSAQVRKKGAVLQHGSLPLEGDLARICLALRYPSEAERERAALSVRQRAVTLAQALGRPVSWGDSAQAIQAGFRGALGIELSPGELTAAERAKADELATEKYTDEEWRARL